MRLIASPMNATRSLGRLRAFHMNRAQTLPESTSGNGRKRRHKHSLADGTVDHAAMPKKPPCSIGTRLTRRSQNLATTRANVASEEASEQGFDALIHYRRVVALGPQGPPSKMHYSINHDKTVASSGALSDTSKGFRQRFSGTAVDNKRNPSKHMSRHALARPENRMEKARFLLARMKANKMLNANLNAVERDFAVEFAAIRKENT